MCDHINYIYNNVLHYINHHGRLRDSPRLVVYDMIVVLNIYWNNKFDRAWQKGSGVWVSISNIWLRKRNSRCHKSSTNDFSINLLNLLEIPACMWVIHSECKWNDKWAINETTQRWYQAWVGVMHINRDKHILLLHNTLEHELVNLRFLSPDPGSFDALL